MLDLNKLAIDINALCRAESEIGPLPALFDAPDKAASFSVLRALIWAGLPPAAGVALADVDDLIGDTPPAALGEIVGAAISKNAGGDIDPEVAADVEKIKKGLGLEAALGGRRFRFTFKALAALEGEIGAIDAISKDPARSVSFTTIRAMIYAGSIEPMTKTEAGEFMARTGYPAACVFIWALMRATFPEPSAKGKTAEAPGKIRAA